MITQSLSAAEFHVAVKGDDASDGSADKPFRTISAGARVAQPGDVVTVHAGTYRERVTPPRGGESDQRRIEYRAAAGETVVIKGSEVVRGWNEIVRGVWKVALPKAFFGSYNPYRDLITGDWFEAKGRVHHTGEVYLNGKSLWETALLHRVFEPEPAAGARDREGSTWTWFCESDEKQTYIYANFHDKNPNEELVEINVRDACIYPDVPGRNYITIRGFRLCQAATQWAAPTAEQIGLVGTHWSKGWIIESNVISDSKCSGITLGKDRKTGHNVWMKDPAKDGAIHYTEVVERALAAGWSKENIGSHLVQNNVIFNCEQTGICGSLGAVFSRISSNHIYNIFTKRQFTGAEMAGIKLHAAIDVVIDHNRIHSTIRGLWMDWMAQGTRITSNLVYDNSNEDLFVEVDHGPFLVDNNVFLSGTSLLDMSEGGAYAHNLFAGKIDTWPEPNRRTPFHPAHSTAVAGLREVKGGDDRFFNNIFIGTGPGSEAPTASPSEKEPVRFRGCGPWVYDTREQELLAGGNVYFNGARPGRKEAKPLQLPDLDPRPRVIEDGGSVFLQMAALVECERAATQLVTSSLLGKAVVPNLPYEDPTSAPLSLDKDYRGRSRDAAKPWPGPFEAPGKGELRLRVW